MSLGWTDERVERLKALWIEGLSAAQIARQLGGVTRNAVIGKVHRLGLSGRAAPSRPGRAAPSTPRARRTTPVRARPTAARRTLAPPRKPARAHEPAAPPEGPGLATAATLGAHMCRWPIGDPKAADFTFCGRRVDDHGPYCRDHHRIANPRRPAKALEDDPIVRRILARRAA